MSQEDDGLQIELSEKDVTIAAPRDIDLYHSSRQIIKGMLLPLSERSNGEKWLLASSELNFSLMYLYGVLSKNVEITNPIRYEFGLKKGGRLFAMFLPESDRKLEDTKRSQKGIVYTVKGEKFRHFRDSEWYSKQRVKPVDGVEVAADLNSLMKRGIQVFYVPMDRFNYVFHEMKPKPSHGDVVSLMRMLTSENERRGIGCIPTYCIFPGHVQPRQVSCHTLPSFRQSSFMKVK